MRDEKNTYDIAILGAGPGGYASAIRAAQLGKKVVIIEKDEVGGTCLNYGCIPTKTIQASTKLYSKFKKAAQFGISADNLSIDLKKIIERKDIVVGKLRKGLQYLFKENKIELIKGKGTLKNCSNIEVAGEQKKTISASKIILATGSSVSTVPDLALDEKTVLSSNGILKLDTIPQKMAIIGAGAIGIEFACIFNELGSKVTIYEVQHQILPTEDGEISRSLQQLLEKKGIEIKLNESIKRTTDYEIILLAAGRKHNTDHFKEIGIELHKNKVVVNEKMETNLLGVYAIGDIAGRYMFAHTASKEGLVAAENACGGNLKMEYHSVPRCTYSDPPVASIGHSEEEAKKLHGSIKVGKFPLMANSKSMIEDERDGFIKIITDPSDKVIGVHILGGNATEIIGEAALAVNKGLKLEDIINTIHAHPTVYESIYEAAENVLKRSIAIINK
jgi:dihydrolipoamide dehydrogenase